MGIGKRIKEARLQKNLKQEELAEMLNVSPQAVSKWESEGGFPEITQLPVLAKIFDVSIDYLMTGKETEPEIITMSKIELCAKNDDVELFKTLGVKPPKYIHTPLIMKKEADGKIRKISKWFKN